MARDSTAVLLSALVPPNAAFYGQGTNQQNILAGNNSLLSGSLLGGAIGGGGTYTGGSTYEQLMEQIRQSGMQATLAAQQFSEREVEAGQADELVRVETPPRNTKFDMNQMFVNMVLVVNKLVETVQRQEEEIERLRLLGGTWKQNKPESDEPFELKSVADSLRDDEEP